MLSNDFINELHARCDIVEIVGQDVELKRRGRTYSALCPFHNEKTPSFYVYPETQSFYCFGGCGKGGDVITYVMLRDNLGYIDAVKLLAARAGLEVPTDADDRTSKQRVSILAANKAAARFFYEQLNTDEGKTVRKYIRDRGLQDNTVVKFGIGFAPNSWGKLTDYLRSKGFYPDDLIEGGLCLRGKNGVYDRFRNRLMFPIIDLRGNVVGFGGRRLNEQDKPKYINTNDTLVYKKSTVMYGLNIAKANPSRTLILAEGYMDVVSLHQAGFDGAVASMGTSLTSQQAKLLSQYADEVVIAYDGDAAGQAARRRAIEVIKPTGMLVRVLEIPDDLDPDEFIKKHGVIEFKRLLDGSGTSTEYELTKAKLGLNLDTPSGRGEYVKKATAIISRISAPSEIEIYAGVVAEAAGVSKAAIISQAQQAKKLREKKDFSQKQSGFVKSIDEEYRNMRRAGDSDEVGILYAKQQLIAVLCQNPDFCGAVSGELSAADFENEELGKLYSVICGRAAAGTFGGFASLVGEVSSETYSTLARFVAKMNGVNHSADDAKFLAKKIKRRKPDAKTVAGLSDEEIMKLISDKRREK